MHVCPCVQRITLDIIPQALFFERGYLNGWGLLTGLDWLVREPQGYGYLCIPSTEIAKVLATVGQHFYTGPGNQTQVLMLPQMSLQPCSTLSVDVQEFPITWLVMNGLR